MTNDDILRALATLDPNNQGVGSLDSGEGPSGPVSAVTRGDVQEGQAAANPWVTQNYSVENPNNYNPFVQFNKGIGENWFEDMDKWKDIKSGQFGFDPKSTDGLEQWVTGGGETGERMLNPEWEQANAYGNDGFSYKGADGKTYVIHANRDNIGNTGNLHGYTVTPLHQNNEYVGYNGIPHDQFDAEGKYKGTALPQNMGHGKFWRDAGLTLAAVLSAGAAGYMLAPEVVGTAGVGATGEVAAGTASGFIGEGAASGIGAWDAALANATAGEVAAGGAGAASGADLSTFYNDYGATAGGNYAPVTDLSSYGTGSLNQTGGGWDAFVNGMTGSGSTGSFFEGLMNDPSKLLKVASLIGSLGDIGKDPAEGMINPTTGGWNGAIPNYTSTRRQLPYDSSRRPGSAPQRHFTDIQYRAEGGPVEGGSGIEGLLKGPGTGQSDHIEATIEGQQPARLAREEFVVPADVVSALGDGSTEAGAEALYQMMDRIRGAAHGKVTQQNRVDPGQVLPA